jgi:hypothetical protein
LYEAPNAVAGVLAFRSIERPGKLNEGSSSRSLPLRK